ncbi:MAG: NRDE family protein [Pseudomonadota bacterium]
MCTLTVAVGLWPQWPLLVAANRDEQLDRASLPPRAWQGERWRFFAPEDAVAGGTWLGLNQRGLFVGVTNRFGAPPDPARRSRGLLVRDLLDFDDAGTAAAHAAALDPAAYNPFHLILADREGAHRLFHDGVRMQGEVLAPGWHVVTERSLGAGSSERPGFVQRAVQALPPATPPDDEALLRILSHHDDPGFEGVCVHAPRWNYGTRSSTLLRLGAAPGAVHWHHVDGPPCTTPCSDLSLAARTALQW